MIQFLSRMLVIALAFLFASANAADDPPQPLGAFDAANEAYERGQWPDAARLYESLLKTGRASPALLFNLGNAYYRQGKLGLAIAHYRQGQRLAPRDEDILANLNFVRERAASFNAAGQTAPSWDLPLRIRPSEAMAAAALCFWITFGALTLRQLNPRFAGRFGLAITAGAILSTLCCALAVWTYYEWARPQGVITAETPARYGPLEESQTAFTLPDGAEVALLDRRGQWLQTRDSSGRIGWVPAIALEVIVPLQIDSLSRE